MPTILDKILASDPSIVGDEAKQIFDGLVLDSRFVWFSTVTGLNEFSLYNLADKFIYGMAGIKQNDSFIVTSQPMHILRFITNDEESPVTTTALVYANGLVVYVSGMGRDLILLLIDKDTCDVHNIAYEKVELDGTS